MWFITYYVLATLLVTAYTVFAGMLIYTFFKQRRTKLSKENEEFIARLQQLYHNR